jgi:hypothetical protein
VAPTAAEFAESDARIKAATRAISWRRPSLDDIDRDLLDAVTVDAVAAEDDLSPSPTVIGAGPLRGVILHKLMEELLIGLVAADLDDLTERAAALVSQVAIEGDVLPEAKDVAQVAIDTFRHQSLIPYIATLVPEFPLYGARSETELISARADAVGIENGRPTLVIDWKSDAEPSASSRKAHESQLLQYLELLDVESGALVYMTERQVQFIRRNRNSTRL